MNSSHFTKQYFSIKVLLYLLIGALLSAAQGQNALTRFYASELGAFPGALTVSPAALSVLEFWGVVNTVHTGDDSLLQIETVGNTVYLGTTQPRGETSLVVDVGGVKHFFSVTLQTPSPGPQHYAVERERPVPRIEDPMNPRIPARNLRGALGFEVITATPISDGTANIFFTFENSSQGVVALDTARVTFWQDGSMLPTEVAKEPLRGLVEPGEVQSGYVTVRGAEEGIGRLRWSVRELQGQSREVTFDETVSIPRR